jgi:hypothetical protein
MRSMKIVGAIALVTLWVMEPTFLFAQAKTSRLFLLEDTQKKQWCSFNDEASWKARVQSLSSENVAVLTYGNDSLSKIDMTQTDQTGDWTVFDSYSIDSRAKLATLSRLINVLPGDWSVRQTFSIKEGKATKTAATVKQLSTGEIVSSPKVDWLPDLPIITDLNLFPFAGLLNRPDLRESHECCVKMSSAGNP